MKEKVKNFFAKSKKVLVASVVGASAIVASCVTAFASGEGTVGVSDINTALGNGLQTASNNIMSGISTILPYALPVLAAILVVVIGIRVFKKVAK